MISSTCSFAPSLSHLHITTAGVGNPLVIPYTPALASTTARIISIRPFPAYFSAAFVTLLAQAGMFSVEDARETLAEVESVFTFVKELAREVPDTLHCFCIEFSLASRLCKVLEFPPFNGKRTTVNFQPTLEISSLSSISEYCNTTCFEILKWAGLNFLQEAQELLYSPELVPIFVVYLAKRRSDALFTFRATFDLRNRLNRMLGYTS